MTNLIKQPWFQILIGIILVVALGLGIYFIGVSKGRSQAGVESSKRQADLLLKSQLALAEADKYKQIADSNLAYAEQVKILAKQSTDKASATESRITEVYNKEQQELNEKYENDKKYIQSDLSNCDRCRDLCQRSNALTAYGPEFSSAACNADTACAGSCNP